MASSKMQRAFSQAVYFRFQDRIILENNRPAWCLSDTGQRLELDFWFPEIALAVEVQGRQHYEFSPLFHADYKEFEAQKKRDKEKRERCEYYSITLLEVYDQLTFEFAVDTASAKFKSLHGKKQEKPREYWLKYMRETAGQLNYLYDHRAALPYGEYSMALNRHREKLYSFLGQYTLQVFEQADSELACRMFYLLQRNMNWLQDRKRRMGEKQHGKNVQEFNQWKEEHSALCNAVQNLIKVCISESWPEIGGLAK